jgi:anthranilate synthase component 1
MPDALFYLSDTFVMFDHLKHSLKIIACAFLTDKNPKTIRAAYKKSIARVESIVKKLREPIPKEQEEGAGLKKVLRVKAFTAKKDFMRMVEKAKRYIRKGDIIQVVLSQIFSKPIRHKPFTIYRNLRNLNPSAYMFYLKFKDLYLIGSSPEMLVRCEDKIVTTRPIAGTRPRGASEIEDLRLEKELLKDAKERAEHIMLVDLGRNDLGRVCEYGSVKLSEFMRIERYSHVMHIVSEIEGRLMDGYDIYDVLRAAFPAGTVSGSPKVRAMEIIDELESFRRGPYAGAVGYFGFSGNLDTCITIRTIVIKKKIAYIQAGAGIVSESKPEREYQETLNKARAQLEAL